jgi:hypothetical protein
MYVKGVAIQSNIDFFKKNYGEYYEEFLSRLASDVKKVYEGNITITDWYEINKFYIDPMRVYAQVANIYDIIEFAKEIGRYSADVTLTGIYKVFLLVASPVYLMKRSSKMMATFYKNANAEIIDKGKSWFRLKISNFPELTDFLEHRILAFSQRALELANCKNVSYIIEQSITQGKDESIIFFSWE